jgi:hypothetical protein
MLALMVKLYNFQDHSINLVAELKALLKESNIMHCKMVLIAMELMN